MLMKDMIEENLLANPYKATKNLIGKTNDKAKSELDLRNPFIHKQAYEPTKNRLNKITTQMEYHRSLQLIPKR
jgi:hypothetical protein